MEPAEVLMIYLGAPLSFIVGVGTGYVVGLIDRAWVTWIRRRARRSLGGSCLD